MIPLFPQFKQIELNDHDFIKEILWKYQPHDKTAVIHFEKANSDIKGLYAVINQKFVEQNWHGIESINREQDIGVEGLRKAKLSYHPQFLVEKFRIKPFEDKK